SRSGTDRDKPYALGGSQFPSIDAVPLPGEQHGHDIPEPVATSAPDKDDAMSRLAERSNAIADTGDKDEGFGASVHKIKEQVLPRNMERVDKDDAANNKNKEMNEEFRP